MHLSCPVASNNVEGGRIMKADWFRRVIVVTGQVACGTARVAAPAPFVA
jgi:hypothetical protein